MLALVLLQLSSMTALNVPGAPGASSSSRRSEPALRATAFDSYDPIFNPAVLAQLGVSTDCVENVIALHKQVLELEHVEYPSGLQLFDVDDEK